MHPNTLTNILKVDAVANVVGGIALLAAGGLLADPIGLGSTWPLWLVGVVLVVNGLENQLVARNTTAGGLTALATVDLLFAAAVLGVAIADPTGAETWMRWTLVGVADVSAAVGITKIAGLRSLSRAADATSVTV